MDILQENNIFNIATTTTASTASAASAASTLALFTLSTQSSSIPSSLSSPSSPSSFSHEYDTANYFSRLPNETVFTILAFVITNQNTVKTTSPTTVYSPHKQLSILSQVNRLFYKIANDVLLWQITFETKFDSEAIIRAGIIDNNLIGDSVNIFNGTKGEGEGGSISSQVQNSSSFVQNDRNIWKELYKERQIALNKIKNYVKPTLPSPFVSNNDDDGETDDFSTTVHLDDFMELNFDDENENINDSDINTNNVDSSTLDSTDQVDDIVDYQLFEFDVDFNFTGNDGARTEEMERDNLIYTFENGEEFQELTLENDMTTTEDSIKEDDIKEDIIKEDTMKENTVKEDTAKEGTIKEDTVNEDILKEDTKDEELLKEKVTEFESNFGIDNTSVINVNGVSQDIDFVSEDLIKFDDPELDSIFASDAIESDNFIDTQAPNVDINTQYNEVLTKDTNNSAKEVDHVAQAQDFSNPEINDDLNITLQDYDESSELLDDEFLKLPDDEESSSKLHEGIPQLQDYEESSTKFQKSEEISSSKQPDNVYTELIGDDLPDYDENEEVSQSRDYEDNQKITNLKDYNEIEGLSQSQDFDGIEASINLQDFNDNQVESSSKEIINEVDLPDYEEDDDDDEITNLQSENIVIENHNYDLPDYVDEEADLFNENIAEINENSIENNIEQQNGLPNNNAIIESENDESPDYETNDENNLPNHDENDDIMVRRNEIEEMDDMFNSDEEDNETFEIVNNNIQLYICENIRNRMRTRRKIIQQNNDPELLKILNIIWKICQENDGMNSEVLLGANVKELTVSLIKSLDKMEAQIEYLSIALQVLSILISWHPELTIDLHKSKSFWMTIRYAMINVDMFFPESEDNAGYKQLVLPASAGSAIHIFFHTNFFNLSNPNEFFDEYVPPPQLIPDSNVFNNVYNKSELEKTIIQPFSEDFSGKWCGYYLYHTVDPSFQMRESVMDIKSLEFSPSKPGKVYYLNHIYHNPVPVTDKVVKEISGSGSDKHGEFVIKHGIITEKGNVNFVKTYVGKHSLIYDGILLPVGICGRWRETARWRGNFWIWKK